MTAETLAAAQAASFSPPEPAPGRYKVLVGDLRTGAVTAVLPMDASWSVRINDAGTISGSLNLADEDVAGWLYPDGSPVLGVPVEKLAPGGEQVSLLGRRRAVDVDSVTAPAKSFLAVEFDGTILEAGPIWSRRTVWNARENSVTVGAAGLWSLFDHRKVLRVLEGDDARAENQTLAFTGSLADIAKQYIETAMEHAGGDLPLVLPADEGGDHVRNLEGFKLPSLGELLKNLTTLDEAIDIAFRPRYRADDRRFIEWVMLAGAAEKPYLAAAEPWMWDASTEAGPVRGLMRDEDGSVITSRAWVVGQGTNDSMLLAGAEDTTLTSAGYPLTERQFGEHKQVKEQETLDSHARGYVAQYRNGREKWEAVVDRDADPRLGRWSVGDWTSLKIPEHPLLPKGRRLMRIIEASGSVTSQNVAVKMAEQPGEV